MRQFGGWSSGSSEAERECFSEVGRVNRTHCCPAPSELAAHAFKVPPYPNRMPRCNRHPRAVRQHDHAVRPSIQAQHPRRQRLRRMLRQVAAIHVQHLHCHDGQRRNKQNDTDPTQVRDPEEGSSCRAPAFVAPQSHGEQQRRNGEADHSQQSRDSMPNFMRDVENRSHRFADAGDHQKPQAHPSRFGVNLRPDRCRQRP
jgi:hypothetical protein